MINGNKKLSNKQKLESALSKAGKYTKITESKQLTEKRITFRDNLFDLRNTAYENLSHLEVVLTNAYTGDPKSERDKTITKLRSGITQILKSDFFEFVDFYKAIDIIAPE